MSKESTPNYKTVTKRSNQEHNLGAGAKDVVAYGYDSVSGKWYALHVNSLGILGVNIISSALPTGAATAALQTTGNATLTSILGAVATEATLSALNAKVTVCNTGAVVIASSALPAGAATEATLQNILNSQAIVSNSVSYNDDNFIAGDSPATHDINTDLGRNATSYSIANTGLNDLQVEISHDGVAWTTAITLPPNGSMNEDKISIDSIRVTWVANTSYFIRAS